MNMDVGALREFQRIWAPVLDAIPAAINMAETQADFERSLKAQAMALEKAKAEVARVYAEADVKLTEVNAQMAQVSDERRAVVADIVAAKESAKVAAEDTAMTTRNQLAEMDTILRFNQGRAG